MIETGGAEIRSRLAPGPCQDEHAEDGDHQHTPRNQRRANAQPNALTSDGSKLSTWPQQHQQRQQQSPPPPPPTPQRPLERLFFAILLPFVFVFLLPTLKLEPTRTATRSAGDQLAAQTPLGRHLLFAHEAASELLRALARLPLDRIRLQSGGMMMLADAAKTEISSKNDLQEEEGETHMMLLQAPAEHRASYAPIGSAGHAAYAHANYGASGVGGVGSESGPQQSEPHVQAIPHGSSGGGGGDYGSDDGGPPSGQGQGEPSVVAESAGQTGGGGGGSALQTRSDLPAVRALNVKCEKNHMTVNIVFDRPFYGMVFSKGHYNDQKCVHLPANSGQTSVNFDIHLGKCGMSSSDSAASGLLAGASTGVQQAAGGSGAGQQQPNGVFIENTIIIQYDPLVQEIYDQARKLRCTWYDYYEKSVTFRPYNVDMLDAVTANFLGDNIQCWMQIQVGKGPWSSEVAGIVKIGQTMTMVLAIKDDESRFDMLVRNCVAHDGKHAPIQLVDEYGCVARPKIMGKFQKVRNFGSSATVVSYAHFQAFKFPDSMSVHFQCVIQVCRYECPEPVCQAGGVAGELAGAGAGPGPAGSYASSGPGAGANGDYAAAGTEMVASGETLPPPPPTHHHLVATGGLAQDVATPAGGNFFNPLQANGSTHHHSRGSNVNLKLDESQGRVQVKLDTSMMAALNGNNGRPAMVSAATAAQQHQKQHQVGPLPPHLLHMAAQGSATAATAPHHMGAASYAYRPALATNGQATGGAAGGVRQQPAAAAAGMVLTSRAQQLQQSMVAPPSVQQSHQQVQSFSPQFPASSGMSSAASMSSRRLAAYTSRMGDQAVPTPPGAITADEAAAAAAAQQVGAALAPYEAEYPLSMIASPRGLRLGSTLANGGLDGQQLNSLLSHDRLKRDVAARAAPATGSGDSNPRTQRQARNLHRDDSTTVATHKTIQVVSPDDVAFSLLDPSDDRPTTGTDQTGGSGGAQRNFSPSVAAAQMSQQNSVCFSTGRFLTGLLVTLGALLASIVIVAYVILRQRSQLEQKLSTVYVEPAPIDHHQRASNHAYNKHHMPTALAPTMVSGGGGGGQSTSPSQSYSYNGFGHHQPQAPVCHINAAGGQDSHKRRQHEEVAQRNNYLSRLCSQFAPASAYWR